MVSIVVLFVSADPTNPVVLDSWITNPASGVFAFASWLGTTTLTL